MWVGAGTECCTSVYLVASRRRVVRKIDEVEFHTAHLCRLALFQLQCSDRWMNA